MTSTYWDGRKNRWTPEEKEKASRRSLEGWARKSSEEKEEISEGLSQFWKKYWNSISEERRKERGSISSEAASRWWAGRSQVDKLESSQKISRTVSKLWALLPTKEFDERVAKGIGSKKAIEGRRRRPTRPELVLGIYLERNFPGEWAYNGNYSQGITIGRKIPDFVNLNGRKAVIEVLGTYWHLPEEEERKVVHYKKYGYECVIVWEYDCFLVGELDKIFKEVSK